MPSTELTARAGFLTPKKAFRVRVRETVPFSVRIGIRRVPAILSHLLRSARLSQKDSDGHSFVHFTHQSPMRRESTSYEPDLQRAKEQNVARVADLLDGTVIPSQEEFSWHRQVGPPLHVRGFAAGPELHDGVLSRGAGGGACQVANMVFWLGIQAGLTVVERHRHGYDLFRDQRRTVPFGCGATVFFPHRDLKLLNPHPWPVQFRLWIRDGSLHGEVRFDRDQQLQVSVDEIDHRFVRLNDNVVRQNRIIRTIEAPYHPRQTKSLLTNMARVAYEIDAGEIE